MRINSQIAYAAMLITMVGCGGSNEGDTSTDAQVVSNVKASNIDFAPGANGRPAGTWRWPDTPVQRITVYIPPPAPGNATEQDYATKTQNTVSQLNTKLRSLLILEPTSTIPTSGNYIRVSYGTAYVPPGSTDFQNFCANVSTGPNLSNPIVPDSQNGIASNPVYVNLGNGRCDVSQDIVTHEFGHALGLANHFAGFGGSGAVISNAYFDTLATLYANAQSTLASNLQVKRAAN